MLSGWRGSVLGLAVAGAAFAGACGGSDRDFTSTEPQGGEAGANGEPAATAGTGASSGGGSGGKAPLGDGATGGSEDAVGGAAEAPATGGAGSAPTPDCSDGYSDWLSASFAFPDGDVIGTADFPSYPWVPSGALEIKSARLQGVGTAIVSQGSAFPYDGSRVRFRARFTDSKQTVTVAANTAADGAGGLRVTLDAAGELIVGEGQAVRGQASLEPLESDVDWFVEVVFKGTEAVATVSGKNYPGGAGSQLKAELNATGLKGTAAGVKASARLDSEAGVSPALDELSIARCGVEPPKYEAKLIDTFERADSATLGKAQLPATATWTTPANSEIEIVDGALQTSGNLQVATIPLQVPLSGLRIRTSLTVVKVASGPSGFWADVNINVTQTSNGLPAQGFWVWADNFTSFYTGIFTGGGELKHDGSLFTGTYYAQLDRDGDVAVVTVRSQSFDGPIMGMQYAGALSPNAEPGTFLTLGDEGGAGVRFEDIRVDNYPSP